MIDVVVQSIVSPVSIDLTIVSADTLGSKGYSSRRYHRSGIWRGILDGMSALL